MTHANKGRGYSRSLYERLVDGGHPMFFLNVQKDYHTALYRQVAEHVYSGNIVDGSEADVLPIWRWQATVPVLWPSKILNVPGSEAEVGTSNVNVREVDATVAVLQVIMRSSSR